MHGKRSGGWPKVVASLAVGLLLSGHLLAADEEAEYRKVRELLSGDVDQAHTALQAAIQEYPDSNRLRALQYSLAMSLRRSGKLQPAADALENYLHYLADEGVNRAGSFLPILGEIYAEMGKFDEGIERADAIIAKAETKGQAGIEQLMDLRGGKALMLAKGDRVQPARDLVDSILGPAQQGYEAEPDNVDRILAYAAALNVHARLVDVLGTDEEKIQASQAFLDFLRLRAAEHKDNANLITQYGNGALSVISNHARKNPALAEQVLNQLKETFAGLDRDDPSIAKTAERIERSLPSYERNIAAGKLHASLIGQRAVPLDAEMWTNGQPLTDADLAGKVVLIDFWAVWCGPCIATFPHLREWHEKYADQGLVIIGVTRSYDYDWDEQNARIQKVESIEPAAYEQMLLKFAAHHQLQHRFMVTPENSQFQSQYGVTGIPQAVLIDRDGIVRLIRVGSGDANAHDLEQMLETLMKPKL